MNVRNELAKLGKVDLPLPALYEVFDCAALTTTYMTAAQFALAHADDPTLVGFARALRPGNTLEADCREKHTFLSILRIT